MCQIGPIRAASTVTDTPHREPTGAVWDGTTTGVRSVEREPGTLAASVRGLSR